MTGFITFDWPAATLGTVVSGINDASQIVGTFYDGINTPHGFVYLGIVGDNLDYPAVGTQTTDAYGINNAITVVGTYEDAGFFEHGFLWSQFTYTPFGDPFGDQGTWASGINDAGQVVGWYADAHFNSHGFLKSGSTYTTLTDPLDIHGTTQATGIWARSSGGGVNSTTLVTASS
jgi:probable HAF family extracellular repeat protein